MDSRNYKNNNRAEKQKIKRVKNNVQLRKDKRDDQLLKRRNITVDENLSPLKENNHQNDQPMAFEDILTGLFVDSDPMLQFCCTRESRKILSKEKFPPIKNFIDCGTLKKFVSFLEWHDNPEMLFEATWTLTNIASGNSEDTEALVKANAVPSLIALISCEHINVAEQAMWALGNIAGDGSRLRDVVLDAGIIDHLLQLASRPCFDDVKQQTSIFQNLAWTVSNLCRNRDPPTKYENIIRLLPLLDGLVKTDDLSTKVDACWAYSYITDGPSDRIDAILSGSFHRQLVYLLATVPEVKLAMPIIRVLGNIITGNDLQTQAVLDCNFIQSLQYWVKNDSKSTLKKELAWVLSNVLAGTPPQIQAVIDSGLVPWIVNLAINGDFKSRREAIWAITNLTSSGNVLQKKLLIDSHGVSAMIKMLETQETGAVEVSLNGLSNLLSDTENREVVTFQIEDLGGLDKIEELQQHPEVKVYHQALDIIEKYFNDEEEVALAASNPVGGGIGGGEFRFDNNVTSSDAQGFQF